MSFIKKLNSQKFKIAIFASMFFFVAIYNGYIRDKGDEFWMSQEAKDFLKKSMDEFCLDLKTNLDNSCRDVILFGKVRYLTITKFEKINVPTTVEVESVFEKYGWVYYGNLDSRRYYCKPPYSASYNRLSRTAPYVIFEIGDDICSKK